ncbi:MAG: cytochrome c3 family protein [Desulfobacula sp.]|jgi:predicted CXXCH cytochrome family protein|nr:cytochrome c3 family protein [Desulfobacula sp.]
MKITHLLKSALSLIALGSVLLCNSADAATGPPTNPNSAKGCAMCHYRWIDTFFIEGKGSELVEYHSEKVAASPEMCYSCHDGSVVDSRVKDVNHLGHKTDVKPPSFMEIPKIFPLDENGKIQCSTCHTAHGVPGIPGQDSSIFMRTANENAQMCVMCHKGLDGGKKRGNHPLNLSGQNSSKEITRATDAQDKIEKKQKITCKTCHASHGSEYEAFLSENPSKSGFCLVCHEDKYFISSKGQRKPLHVVNIKPVKAKIPGQLIKMGAKLDKNGEIICRTCHKVHQNKPENNLLIIRNDENSGLCLTCHTNKQYVAYTKHNLGNTAPEEKNLQGTTVKETGICSACHLPHKPARELSGNKDITTQICLSCHSKGNVAEKVNLTGKTHPLKINPFKKRKNSFTKINITKEKLTLPLFNKFGVEDINGDMICTTCHATHGTQAKTGKNKPNKYFLRKKPPLVCKECHFEKFSIIDTQHNLKKSAPLEKNILGQTITDSGLCGSCHLIHGSQKGFLWARKTDSKDMKTNQHLCTSCHNEHGIAQKKVNKGFSHPLNRHYNDKKVGSGLPLFDRAGKYSSKGNLSCYTCHDPHISKVDRKTNTLSFLRKNPPGLCKCCHTDKFDISNSKHDLSNSKKNRDKKGPISGATLCKTCHSAHNADNSFLWAKKDVQGNECLGCHNKEGLGKQNVLKDASHPVNISIFDKGITTHLPLYDKTGAKSKKGLLSCYTCHNPHKGGSQNFLRLENSPASLLCDDCHPGKGLIGGTDHDLIVTGPESLNVLNQTPGQSGTCGVCHLVHNSTQKFKLWAQDLGEGDTLYEKVCNSCHRENGSAKNKLPQISSHPPGQHIKNIGRDIKGKSNFFPLFSPKTGEPVNTGNISCPSCHNLHQWSHEPGKANLKGNRLNIEGNALNSFLRPPAATQICKDCHGPDSLFRFKFFHKIKIRE